MDLGTLVGFVGGLSLVILVMILSGSLMMYWDFLSLLIVLGGAACGTMMKWNISHVINAIKVGMKALFNTVDDPNQIIDEIISLADTARKNSILALEKVEVQNEFLAKSVRFMVDGYDQGVINEIIDVEMVSLKRRHKMGRQIFDDMAEACPAFGMIGTVIGLIVIMANLDDPDKIGPGLAVALITTLYGSLIANMVFIPVSGKLKLRSDEEILNLVLIKNGVNAILGGENPRTIKQKLDSFLAPTENTESEAA